MAADNFDEYCLERLNALSIHDEALVDYIKGVIQETTDDEDETVELLESILEAHGSFSRSQIEALVRQLVASSRSQRDREALVQQEKEAEDSRVQRVAREQQQLQEEAEARIKKEKLQSEDAQKARIISQYGKVEDETVEADPTGLLKPRLAKTQEADTTVIELPPEGKKALKQWRAQQTDLMVKPNNAEIVKLKEQKDRESARAKAAQKKSKDKEDLTKQKENQAKDLEAKRKRAAKLERRA